MKICEIFETVQGEGPNLGVPSLFIRTGGCNLRCQFKGEACDTPYAVFTNKQLDKKNPSLKYGYGVWHDMTVHTLSYLIAHQNIRHIVWTGGEPLLWQDEILEIINMLDESFSHEFESNGTIVLIDSLRRKNNVNFNLSVKLSSSNQEESYKNKTINTAALLSYPQEKSIYKFVITNPKQDLEEINNVIKIKKLPVYLMPEGLTRETVIKNSPVIVQMAIDNNFRFTPREHINIWDQKKGV